MEEPIVETTKPKKVPVKSMIIVAIFILFYLGLRIRAIDYMDEQIWIFSMTNIGELRASRGTGFVMYPHTIHTSFGDMKLGLFLNIGYRNDRLTGAGAKNIKNQPPEHTLSILGQPLSQEVHVGFSENYQKGIDPVTGMSFEITWVDGRQVSTNGNIKIEDYSFNILSVDIENRLDFESLRFHISSGPKSITLSDGTILSFDGYSFYLFIQNSGSWNIQTENDITIKKPKQTAYLSKNIEFAANWGKLITAPVFIPLREPTPKERALIFNGYKVDLTQPPSEDDTSATD